MTGKLFIEVHYQVKSGLRQEFYKKVIEEGIADASRAEAGNGRYDYFYSIEDENELVLLEVWDTVEDQEKHAKTSHYQKLAELKKSYVNDTRITKFEIVQ